LVLTFTLGAFAVEDQDLLNPKAAQHLEISRAQATAAIEGKTGFRVRGHNSRRL
jgi:hypothetical protein